MPPSSCSSWIKYIKRFCSLGERWIWCGILVSRKDDPLVCLLIDLCQVVAFKLVD